MPARILYCNCTYAQVVPAEVKAQVLRSLVESGVAFDAVADLCELSAKRDPALKDLIAGESSVRIAACFPRAVKWLFNAAGVDFPENRVSVCNMRTEPATDIVAVLIEGKPITSTPAPVST